MRVLVVEDEVSLQDQLKQVLQLAGYAVDTAGDGASGFEIARKEPYALIILDVGLPGLDGIEVCRRLRAGQDRTPVLFVTARDDEVDRILGLEIGADDYVTKPFSPRELAVRVRTVLRRAGATDGEVLVVGGIRLDVDRRRVHAGDEEVSLTATEFDLLAHLMRVPGRVFSREQLLSAVWGYPAGAGTRTVDVHVAQLRAKLGPGGPIRTVRGVGYAADKDPR
jgi:DNA-binding response OmpR family regulator